MKKRFTSALALTLSVLSSTVIADTTTEVRQAVLDHLAHMNQELNQDPMRLSKDGSKEFFSSGGLLNHLDRTSGGNTFEMFQGSIKHIEVVVLVEGQAAVAHFYQEAMMQPTGLPAVPNYRTRVTQIFVKEEGDWKIRAAHWSPLMGGAGTSQTVIN
ncbi:MAG: nuclear transport factor 2 family protein [Pseudomonadales bacterium]|nr:nuclear transport factor 2 family protein [Pseudomonadales bacterium]